MWTELIVFISRDEYNKVVYDHFKSLINKETTSGCTPLHFACLSEKSDVIVPYLLDNGALINKCNKFAETPIFWAVRIGNIELVRYLIYKGAYIFYIDSDGNTLLHWAAEYNHECIIKLLLNLGLYLSLNNDKKSPLDIAIYHESYSCIEVLELYKVLKT